MKTEMSEPGTADILLRHPSSPRVKTLEMSMRSQHKVIQRIHRKQVGRLTFFLHLKFNSVLFHTVSLLYLPMATYVHTEGDW